MKKYIWKGEEGVFLVGIGIVHKDETFETEKNINHPQAELVQGTPVQEVRKPEDKSIETTQREEPKQ